MVMDEKKSMVAQSVSSSTLQIWPAKIIVGI